MVKQGWAVVVRGYPVSIGVGDLVVDPGKRASCRPIQQGAGFPVQPEPSVFGLRFVAEVGPGNHRKRRQPDPWRYLGVRLFFPRGGPDQLARQRRQLEAHLRAQPCQAPVSAETLQFGPRICAERKQRPVDV